MFTWSAHGDLQGIRLGTGEAWYSQMLRSSRLDESFLCGVHNVGGFELGLDPSIAKRCRAQEAQLAYWGVRDLKATIADLTSKGVKTRGKLRM